MVEIEIDGKKLSVSDGTTIIEAAEEVGIYIPRFCYHKKLSIAANCRMCLVEVEKVGKPMPACATPVTPDMKVLTQSEKALAAQRAVMEFLLINHPLDCPICDQGGECELQDLAMGYGSPFSYYEQSKRAVLSQDIGPLIETEMTRCIHCTRCVRFGEEIANLRELGATGRGEHMEIGTYVKHFLRSELSGNVIDLCPVGALTGKPWRYEVRSWELQEHCSIAPHDCVGANLYYHSRGRALVPQRIVMRAVPRENEAINETWLSDCDRFSAKAIYHADRIKEPMLKEKGRWREISWQEALPLLVKRLQQILNQHGAEKVGALLSPNLTLEDLFISQKFLRHLGINNIDHRYRQQDFSHQENFSFPNLNMPIAELERKDCFLLVGSNVRFDQPLLAHRINKATQDEAKVLAINPVDFSWTFPVAQKIIALDLVTRLAAVTRAVAELKNQAITELNSIVINDPEKQMAEALVNAQKPAVILGLLAVDHPQAAQLHALGKRLAQLLGCHLSVLSHGPNTAGAWLAGALPHRATGGETIAQPGFNGKQMLVSESLAAYFLMGLEPEFDTAYSATSLARLKQAELVVSFNAFITDAMRDYADLILPIAPHTEHGGTFVNAAGDWQSFAAVSVPHHNAKPLWKVIRVMAQWCAFDNFEYHTEHHLHHDIKQLIEREVEIHSAELPLQLTATETNYVRLAPWPMYRVDGLVRRAQALQEVMHEDPHAVIRINSATAKHFNLQNAKQAAAIQGDSRVVLPLIIDARVADHAVLIPAGLNETAGFGEAYAPIQLEEVAG